MPREVFADEIERFLTTLDGVSSARVLTGPDGDVSFVYVTTDSASDSRGLRGGVAAALQAHFGIPIDEWRVRVTQLRAGASSSEIPHFRIARVEETAAGADLAVVIKLEWREGAEERTAVGKAHARAGVPGGASRAFAAATIAAVRDALHVPHGELALDRVGSATFLDRPVILVALSAAVAGQMRTIVGTAFDEAAAEAAAEPAAAAALDAVMRWLVHTAFAAEGTRPVDRRDRLEAMRHFTRDAASDARAPAAEDLGRDTPSGVPGRAAGSSEPMAAPERWSRAAPVRALPPRRAAVMRNGEQGPGPLAEGGGAAGRGAPRRPPDPEPDVLDPGAHAGAVHRHGAGETAPRPRGPQTREGTAMGLQHETPEIGSGGRPVRPPGVEDAFYRSLVAERTPVHLRCRDGYEVPNAIIRDAGTYALLVETDEGLELFFKHAIISIRVLPKPAPQA
jgi:sRNA-binding regulator protein Hfq